MKYAQTLASPCQTLCLSFPLRKGRYLAQFVIPRDMTKSEATRLGAFVMSLAQPSNQIVASPDGRGKG